MNAGTCLGDHDLCLGGACRNACGIVGIVGGRIRVAHGCLALEADLHGALHKGHLAHNLVGDNAHEGTSLVAVGEHGL